MTRVLLTGGSGFITAHVLDYLLEHGHSVVTSVRSQAKAQAIKDAHSNYGKELLDFVIVEDIAKPGAFDQAILSDPPFEAVIHTASPFHFNATDIQKDLLDPAIIGTTGILKSIKAYAPTVKRVVITSSFAAIVDRTKGARPDHTYTDKDWNPISHAQALGDSYSGYVGSKKLAEKAAWEFVEKEKPGFSISTLCPPLVFGPIVHYLNSLDALNTSNERVRNIIRGEYKDEIPETGVFIWVDVRDLALAHVTAMEKPEAANQRFFITAGKFSNKEVCEIITKNFPEYRSKLPDESVPGGRYPEGGVFGTDIGHTKSILGGEFRSLESSIVDLVRSLKSVGA